MKRLVLSLSAVLAMAVSAHAGSISGVISDETGGVIPGTHVTLSGSGVTRSVVTGPDGAYRFDGLSDGTYTLAADLVGFRQTSQKVSLSGDADVTAAFTLHVALRGEDVVVTASRVETRLVDAPATMSVISAEDLEDAPVQNFGDILRRVPGVNVIQTSARDVQLSTRQSTSTLAASQLVLLDGRSVYLDFFGFVLWDLVPTNPEDIKQIEVVRGPASAVWGANALTGVVNIITKTPREAVGTRLTLTGGLLTRDEGSRAEEGDGNAWGASLSLARAPSDTLSFKLTGGYYQSDAYSRPTGRVPIATHPLDASIVTGGVPYPVDQPGVPGSGNFENTGTRQPKFDLRLDQELSNGGRISYSGGWAGTEGIIHTGIGPFDIQSGSWMGYGRVGYSQGAFKAAAFANFLDADAPNLLLPDPDTGGPVILGFKTQTYDLEAGHSSVVADRHILSYGGNARRNAFDITLTPNVEDRNEFGVYFQDEIYWDKFRLAIGGRADKFGNLEDWAFSPRVTAMFKPTPDHSLRVSFNRAFRSPSAVNNYLNQRIFAPGVAPIDLRPVFFLLGCHLGAPNPLCPLIPQAPVPLIVRNIGSEESSTDPRPRQSLVAEELDAWELAYTGTFNGKTTVGIALYQNDTDDNINFVQITPSVSNPSGLPGFDVYSAENSAETGIPGPVYGALTAAGILPRLPRTVSTYLNLSGIRQRGVELSIDHAFNAEWSLSTNYSWQDTPERLDPESDQIPYPTEEVGIPPKHLFNAALSYRGERFFGNAHVNYTDKAFWVDVLSSPFHGATDSFTMVNAAVGMKFDDGRITATIKGQNLFNDRVQQHIFGDIIKRSLFGELRFSF